MSQRKEVQIPYEPRMTSAQVAVYLSMSPGRVRDKANKGELPTAGKVGNHWRFVKSSLDNRMRKDGARS